MEIAEFTALIKSIVKGFEEEEKTGAIETIGKGDWGLPRLLAEYDVAWSEGSGSWLQLLEESVEIAQAMYVMKHVDRFAGFAERLIATGRTTAESAVEIGIPDGKMYAKKAGKDILMLWVLTQSTAFVVKLKQHMHLAKMVGKEMEFEHTWLYSAREISQKSWRSGKLKKEAFQYNDSRDKGYCGTVQTGCVFSVNYGFLYTKDFRRCFDILYFQCN